jgi:hypothetical protein
MAESVKIATVTAAIAALNISGVNVRDAGKIPESVNPQDCPLLAPRPDNFVTNLSVEEESFGGPAAARKSCRYTLNYNFYFAPVAEGHSLFEGYAAMVTKAAAVLLALATTILSAAHEHQVSGIPQFGPVVDAAGTLFHGCVISVNVRDLMEAA